MRAPNSVARVTLRIRARRFCRFFAIGLAVTACASGPSTDLAALYQLQAGNPDQPPVVIVHGALGSRLRDASNGKELWPGSFRQLLFSDYRNLRYDIDPISPTPDSSSTVVGGIADSVLGVDYYGRILKTLEQIGGYRPATPGTAADHAERRYYVFTYDWRQDNVQSARARQPD